MRIYEFKCKKCSEEYLLRTTSTYNGEKLQCPNCGGEEFDISDYSQFLMDSYSDSSCSFG